MTDYLRQSPRDLGAGLAAGGTTFLAVMFFIISGVVQGYSLEARPAFVLVILGPPVVAFLVAAIVWRVAMPDELNPVYGAIAGVFAAVVSTLIVTTTIGLMAAVTGWYGGLIFAGFIVFYGAIFALPFVVPIGASVGYGYEWYRARGQE